MRRPRFQIAQTEDIGAAIIAYDIAIVSILHTLARNQPDTAQGIAKTMEEIRKQLPETQIPKALAKLDGYIEGIRKLTSQNPQ